MRRLALGLCLASIGCINLAPDAPEPSFDLVGDWLAPLESGASSESSSLATWYTQFDDPVLSRLIEQALDHNLDWRIAFSRVMEARALRGVATGQRWPAVDLDAGFTRFERSETRDDSFGLTRLDAIEVGPSATWEVDLWGRLANTARSADHEQEAALDDARAVLVALTADVASEYTALRSLDEQIRIAARNAELQSNTVELTNARLDAGLVTELDVAQAKAQLGSTRARVPELEALRYASLTRLALLLARRPSQLDRDLLEAADMPSAPLELAVGLPGELLRRRPDICAAERRVAAQAARVGVARADLLPSFSIFGTFGFQSSELDDLFESSSQAWSFGPALSLPIFRAGELRSRIAAEEARLDIAALEYERSVLTAVQEAESALQSFGRSHVRAAELDDAGEQARLAVAKSEALYRSGLTDFQSVLDSQRQLFQVEESQVLAQTSIVQDAIRLMRALGGGWDA